MLNKIDDFDFGYNKKYNNNTFNHKDKLGCICLFNFSLLIILIILCIITKNFSLYLIFIFIIFLICIICYYSHKDNKIHILYLFSYIISENTRTPEFLDVDIYFKNHNIFEDNFIILKDEALNYLNVIGGIKKLSFTRDSLNGENSYIGSDMKINDEGIESGWRLVTLKIGSKTTDVCNIYFSKLKKILDEVPEIVACALSILEPGVMIPIHNGYYKGILRYMIPLVVPKDKENCFLWVNGIKYCWTAGKSVLWDDMYPHKVYNNTNENRILFYMDVIRPLD